MRRPRDLRNSVAAPAFVALMTRTALIAALGATFAVGPAEAAEEQQSPWAVTVGAGAIAAPEYPGSASLRILPLPLIDVRYGNRFFLSPLGTGVNLIADRELRLGVSVMPELGRTADAARRLGRIGPAAEAKLFAETSTGPMGFVADVRHQLGGADGTLIDAGVQTQVPLPGLFVTANALLTWADGEAMRSYFGAPPSGPGLSSFTPGAGLQQASVSLMAFHLFDPHWGAQVMARAAVLLGDAAASPVVERKVQPSFGGFLTYRI